MTEKILQLSDWRKKINPTEITQRYEQLFSSVSDAIFILQVAQGGSLTLVDINAACEQFLSVSAKDVVGKRPEEVLEPGLAGELTAQCRRCIQFEAPLGYEESRDLPYGMAHLYTTLAPIVNEEGDVCRIIGITHDITSQKFTEKKIRESEVLYRELFELESDAILLTDALSGSIVDANRMASAVYGYSRKELLGMTSTDLCARPDEDPCIGDTRQGNIPLRWHKRKNGDVFPVEITASYLSRNNREVMIAAIRDVTERVRTEEEHRRLQNQLIQSQKMEALGQLAAGIAHDFNNVLTVMFGYCHILKTKAGNNPSISHAIEQICLSANRAAELTGGLLAFSRQQSIIVAPVEIADILKETEKTFRCVIRADITFIIDTHVSPLIIKGDKHQIGQVLLNLITNAVDAMPNGGILTITAEKVRVSRTDVATENRKPGDYACISVSDTGIGMSKETVEKVFEPFFTTKPSGKGTGLGMSIVYGIVNRHGGFIEVDSREGEGTTFRLLIPLSIPETVANLTLSTACRTVDGCGETILLAEDDDDMRSLVTAILTGSGYRVIEAVDGDQSIREIEQNYCSISLIMLDIVMPKTDGNSVYRLIREHFPDIKVILMSGYCEDILKTKGFTPGEVHFLQKPFKPEDLLKTVREAIEQCPAHSTYR